MQGQENSKVLPRPTALSTGCRPPSAPGDALRWPGPGRCRRNADWPNRLPAGRVEEEAQALRADADAGIGDAKVQAPGLAEHAEADAAGFGGI